MTLEIEQQQRQELHPPTEVLDKLNGFKEFFYREGELKYDPKKVDFWVIAGLSGVGKSVAAGQLRKRIEFSRIRAKKIAEAPVLNQDWREEGKGKHSHVEVRSWDFFLSEFVKSDPKKIWGNLPVEDYNAGALDMSLFLHRLKILFTANQQNYAPTIISTLPLFTGARGGELVMRGLDYNNTKVIALTADEFVLENAAIVRDALKHGKEAFLKTLAERGIKIDKKEIDDEYFEWLKTTMGTRESIEIHENALKVRMLDAKDKLRKKWLDDHPGKKLKDFPNFDENSLVSDPILRQKVKTLYFDYFLGEELRIPKSNYIVARNVYNPKINFYLSAIEPPRPEEMPISI